MNSYALTPGALALAMGIALLASTPVWAQVGSTGGPSGGLPAGGSAKTETVQANIQSQVERIASLSGETTALLGELRSLQGSRPKAPDVAGMDERGAGKAMQQYESAMNKYMDKVQRLQDRIEQAQERLHQAQSKLDTMRSQELPRAQQSDAEDQRQHLENEREALESAAEAVDQGQASETLEATPSGRALPTRPVGTSKKAVAMPPGVGLRPGIPTPPPGAGRKPGTAAPLPAPSPRRTVRPALTPPPGAAPPRPPSAKTPASPKLPTRPTLRKAPPPSHSITKGSPTTPSK